MLFVGYSQRLGAPLPESKTHPLVELATHLDDSSGLPENKAILRPIEQESFLDLFTQLKQQLIKNKRLEKILAEPSLEKKFKQLVALLKELHKIVMGDATGCVNYFNYHINEVYKHPPLQDIRQQVIAKLHSSEALIIFFAEKKLPDLIKQLFKLLCDTKRAIEYRNSTRCCFFPILAREKSQNDEGMLDNCLLLCVDMLQADGLYPESIFNEDLIAYLNNYRQQGVELVPQEEKVELLELSLHEAKGEMPFERIANIINQFNRDLRGAQLQAAVILGMERYNIFNVEFQQAFQQCKEKLLPTLKFALEYIFQTCALPSKTRKAWEIPKVFIEKKLFPIVDSIILSRDERRYYKTQLNKTLFHCEQRRRYGQAIISQAFQAQSRSLSTMAEASSREDRKAETSPVAPTQSGSAAVAVAAQPLPLSGRPQNLAGITARI